MTMRFEWGNQKVSWFHFSFPSFLETLRFGFGRLFLFIVVWTGSFKSHNKSKSLTEHRTWAGFRIGSEEV
jgi:hypothetical protein